MTDHLTPARQTQLVNSFAELVGAPFTGVINARCWTRELQGDFGEIVSQVPLHDNMTTLSREQLLDLDLSEPGQLARATLLNDLRLLEDHGAAPVLNLIGAYDRDAVFPFFPTDVYSWHVDRSPVPVDTFLCTYHGAASDILPNDEAIQKVQIPELRARLRDLHDGAEEDFEAFLREYFFDLHYQAKPGARPINLGRGNLWRLAIDQPEGRVPACIHRAPVEADGKVRLMMIC